MLPLPAIFLYMRTGPRAVLSGYSHAARVSLRFFADRCHSCFPDRAWRWVHVYGRERRTVTLAPAHAHLNLVGWVTMALYGTFYALTRGTMSVPLAWMNFMSSRRSAAIVMIPTLSMHCSSISGDAAHWVPFIGARRRSSTIARPCSFSRSRCSVNCFAHGRPAKGSDGGGSLFPPGLRPCAVRRRAPWRRASLSCTGRPRARPGRWGRRPAPRPCRRSGCGSSRRRPAVRPPR